MSTATSPVTRSPRAARWLRHHSGRRAVLLAVFVAAAGYAAYVGFNLQSRIGATRTQIPGQRTVELAPRKYVVYFEPTGHFNPDEAFSAPSGLQVRIAPPGGRPLSLHSYDTSLYLGSSGSQAVALDTVEVPHPGRYVISTAVPTVGSYGETVVLGIPQGTAIIRLVIAGLIALAAFTALLSPHNSFWGALGLGPGSPSTLATPLRRPWRLLGFGPDDGAVLPAVVENMTQPLPPATESPTRAGPLPSADPLDKLAKLADLRDQGVLTSEEFDAQKLRILGGADRP